LLSLQKLLLLPSPEVSCTTNARGKINPKTRELATLNASHLLVSPSLFCRRCEESTTRQRESKSSASSCNSNNKRTENTSLVN
jgi:hypothetical protein